MNCFMLAGTDDHLTRLSPVILNLESTGLTHLESEIRVLAWSPQIKLLIPKHNKNQARAQLPQNKGNVMLSILP